MKWSRTVPFSADYMERRVEKWHCHHPDGTMLDFDVSVQSGKPLDIMALKGLDLAQFCDYAKFLEKTASRLYGMSSCLRKITLCPCCGAPSGDKNENVLTVFGTPYIRCHDCGHVFVSEQPSRELHQQFFSDSDSHSAVYVDREVLQIRLEQVAKPKLQWCLDQFAYVYKNKRPLSVIDVGAGGGHFLAAAANLGISVDGFELSKTSRQFAAEAFGLTLQEGDFLSAEVVQTDLITFLGLLEYVAEPAPFVTKARKALSPDGMLVVEVPRADALGTAAQKTADAVIGRHMDPTSHIQAFSDESLMTLLMRGGFQPVAAWYFGMDIYEVLLQAAVRLGDPTVLKSMGESIPALQKSVDLGRQCDDIIVAAVPIPG